LSKKSAFNVEVLIMQESIYYSDMRWPELEELAKRNAIILLPLGQTEEHGPHLPVGCDHFISQEIARRVAQAAVEEIPVLVMPTIWCGYSGSDLFKWPGVISLEPELVISIIENICFSLSRSGFQKIIIMNSHGHHVGITRVAVRKVADRCDASVIATDIWKMGNEAVSKLRESEPGGCCHAGEYETSLMLHFNKRVDMSKAKDEPVISHSKLVSGDNFGPGSKVFWSTWRYQKSETGTYGCPSLANKDKGEKMVEGTIAAYIELLREFHRA